MFPPLLVVVLYVLTAGVVVSIGFTVVPPGLAVVVAMGAVVVWSVCARVALEEMPSAAVRAAAKMNERFMALFSPSEQAANRHGSERASVEENGNAR